MREIFDFSKESNIQDSLLKEIKYQFFGELDEDELGFVNAAGNTDDLRNRKNSDDKDK